MDWGSCTKPKHEHEPKMGVYGFERLTVETHAVQRKLRELGAGHDI
jgi:hypothetical protein